MKTDKKILLYLLLWSTAVLMLMSTDSPIHGVWNRCDSAWFFMCGKSMMNGLRPYVDFADSKGPLLWLIYGVGYLLSPRNYTGVWMLTCLCYTGIFYFNYKTARIFLKDNHRSLMVTLLMPFPYFLYWFHNETRAEDFALLPVAASMYYLSWLLYGCGDASAQLTERRCGLVLGGCFMALVLIKFNIAAMQASMVFAALWYYAREQHRIVGPVKWLAAGAASLALPFIAYLIYMGSLPAFFQEYLIQTIATVSAEGGYDKSYLQELADVSHCPEMLTLLLVILFGGWQMWHRLPHYRAVPLLTGVVFFGLSTMHYANHYYVTCTIFVLYLFVSTIAGCPSSKTGSLAVAMSAILAWGIFENVRPHTEMRETVTWSECEGREVYKEISQAMSGVPHPRILNLFSHEQGFGVDREPLPAGKYWCCQKGMTKEMLREHVELLKSGNTDFVIIFDDKTLPGYGMSSADIESCGYDLCYSRTYNMPNSSILITTVVYKKHNNE